MFRGKLGPAPGVFPSVAAWVGARVSARFGSRAAAASVRVDSVQTMAAGGMISPVPTVNDLTTPCLRGSSMLY